MDENYTDIVEEYFRHRKYCNSLDCAKVIFEPQEKKEWFFDEGKWCYFKFLCDDNDYRLIKTESKDFDDTCILKDMSYEIKMLLSFVHLRNISAIEKDVFSSYVNRYENAKKSNPSLTLEKFNFDIKMKEEEELEVELTSFLGDFFAGFSSSEDDSDSEEELEEEELSFLGDFFLGFSSSEDDSDSELDEELSFFAAFLLFFFGFSSDSELDSLSELLDAFLLFLLFFFGFSLSEDDEDDSDEEEPLDFFSASLIISRPKITSKGRTTLPSISITASYSIVVTSTPLIAMM